MRTTLTLEDDVAVRLEKLREDRGDSLKAVVNEALRRGLDALDRGVEDRPRYQVRPVHLGRSPLPNLDKTATALAFGEGEDHR